ncbi:MAG: hypothetical protein PHN56_04515 [Candidatus Nanoarchaeia archaeon]|nr:hypothetical protein [Candidatus Nanoarchaeia archaeon]
MSSYSNQKKLESDIAFGYKIGTKSRELSDILTTVDSKINIDNYSNKELSKYIKDNYNKSYNENTFRRLAGEARTRKKIYADIQGIFLEKKEDQKRAKNYEDIKILLENVKVSNGMNYLNELEELLVDPKEKIPKLKNNIIQGNPISLMDIKYLKKSNYYFSIGKRRNADIMPYEAIIDMTNLINSMPLETVLNGAKGRKLIKKELNNSNIEGSFNIIIKNGEKYFIGTIDNLDKCKIRDYWPVNLIKINELNNSNQTPLGWLNYKSLEKTGAVGTVQPLEDDYITSGDAIII